MRPPGSPPGPLGKLPSQGSQSPQGGVPEGIQEEDLARLENGHLITQQLLSTPPARRHTPPSPPGLAGPSSLP